MFLPILKVLKESEVRAIRARLVESAFADGAATAGKQARRVKNNQQVPRDAAGMQEVAKTVSDALQRNPAFIAAALPRRLSDPLFNRYAPGMRYGSHVDNAILFQARTMRTDVSVTVFLSEPAEYEGGELVIEQVASRQKIKLAAGTAFLYPATSLHRVEPVTRGARLAAVVWVQSLVRDSAQRTLLFELDRAAQAVVKRDPDSPEAALLGKTYHNLLRMWADA